MNLGEKKHIFLAGGIIGLAVLVLLVVVIGGKKKTSPSAGPGETGRARGTTTAQGPGGAGLTGAAAPARLTAEGAAPGAVPGAPAAGATPAVLPAPGQMAAVTPGVTPPTPAPGKPWNAILAGSAEISATTRPDPTLFIQPPPRKITPEELVQLPPVNLQAGGLRSAAAETAGVVTNVANRRVAGVKFNGGAWAILEEEEGKKTFVVKPGDVIDGTRINSISREAIYITDPQGQKWVVPLRGAGPGSVGTPVGTPRRGSSPATG